MPQDSLRSVVYRSFVSCDDPNGVVECGTIRKAKISSRKMDHKTNSKRTEKATSKASLDCKEERKEVVCKGTTEELQPPPPFQLLEVSRGAQKLNEMIDSWSKGPNFDGQSKDIARDLLRGALDLQESLVMLGKLQDASKHMARLKKKQKLKAEQGGRGGDEVGIEIMDLDRLRDKSNQIGLQKPRLSTNESSRNSVEELKKVIRDSLSRHLPTHSIEEKVSWNQRKLESKSDLPSTSSSQNWMVHSSNSASTDSSIPSIEQQKKAKAPNLIAKLLGLEEFPSEPIQPPKKQLESERNTSQARPIFDINMPKARRPLFIDRNVDPERKTLKEIIATMQSQGLLKSYHAEGLKPQSHLSNTPHLKQELDDENPPIVIIKPLCFSRPQTEDPPSDRSSLEEGALEPERMFRKVEEKVEPQPKRSMQEKGALNSKEILRKLEAKERPPTRRFIHEDRALGFKELPRKPEVKEPNTKEKAPSNKMKASPSLNHKPQKIESANKTRNASPDRKKPPEKENLKSLVASRYQEKVKSKTKATTSTSQKPESGSIVTKNRVSIQESATPSSKLACSIQCVSQKSTDQMMKNTKKKAKPVQGSLEVGSVTQKLQCKDDVKEMDSVLTTISISLADEMPTEDGADASEIQIEDHCENDQNSLREVTPLISQLEILIESAEVNNQLVDRKSTKMKFFEAETDLKRLLLNSSSFRSYAEELFDLNGSEPVAFQTNGVEEDEISNARVFLDCTNELMEHKWLQTSQATHPLLLTQVLNPRIISLDQLVEEVCDGIEKLRSYSKAESGVLPMDTLYRMLERDLLCKRAVLNCVWELGWMNGFSVEEVEQVVGEVEKQVLSGLIEEIVLDFVC